MWVQALRLPEVLKQDPDNRIVGFLAHQFSHATWAGFQYRDFPQAAFCFLVGMSLPYSISGRRRRGQSLRSITLHAMRRAVILVLLGIFLRSLGKPRTDFVFIDTLSQTGLAYPFIFALCFVSSRAVWTAIGAILGGYWLVWAAYPLPGASFDWSAVHAPVGGHLKGFAQHWDMNSNVGVVFDRWFLNLFPREEPFVANAGGYVTLNFVPAIASMCFGMLCTRWERAETPSAFMRRASTVGLLLVTIALVLHWSGLCPIVKRVWTPSYTLFAAGLCFLLVSLFTWAHGTWAPRWLEFPFIVLGANPLVTYCMYLMVGPFILAALHRHVPAGVFAVFGPSYAPFVAGLLQVTVFWLILYYLYRKRIYVKI